MGNFFRKRAAQTPRPQSHPSSEELLSALERLQRAYWVKNPEEKNALAERPPDSLSWPELLRLHHLTCLELLDGERAQWMSFEGQWAVVTGEASSSPAKERCRDLAIRLVAKDSPYRIPHCVVRVGAQKQVDQPPAKLVGQLWNMSITHLGCLEVFRLDEQLLPKELTFIPFDDIRAVDFARPAILRAAKILYNDERSEEIVWMPLIYGTSWFTTEKRDREGSWTRFCCSITLDQLERPLGIGIGQQDFLVSNTLFGLGSMTEITVILESDDPRFEQKCIARGLDPISVRRQIEDE